MQKRRDLTVAYEDSGEIISNTLTSGVIWNVKQNRVLAVSYCLKEIMGYGGKVEMYARNQPFGEFLLIGTIDSANADDLKATHKKFYENDMQASGINVWEEMEVRMVLYSDTATHTLSPIVYEASLIYEDNLKS